MNIECNCKYYNCKHNVYIQPPRSKPQQKSTRYFHSGTPMQFESEQKLSYKNHYTQSNTPMTCLSIKTNCLKDNLKFGDQHSFNTIQHSSYKKWALPNNIVIKKPRDCVDLLGRGPLNLNTTQKIEYQRKIPCQDSKHYKPSCYVIKLNMPVDNQSTYHTSYDKFNTEKQEIKSFKSTNTYMTPSKKNGSANNEQYKLQILD